MRESAKSAAIRLDPRAEEVLHRIIHHHVLSSSPVGSRTVAKSSREKLSAATIRNIMADLEESGYLSQPHTSAGRLPTEKAYRYYVDTLRGQPPLPRSEKSLVESSLQEAGKDREALLGEVSRLLSRLSHQIGMVSAPHLFLSSIKRIEFRGLGDRRILIIFVDSSGHPQSSVVTSLQTYSQEELDRMGEELLRSFLVDSPEERNRRLVPGEGHLPDHDRSRESEAFRFLRLFLNQVSAENPVFVEGTEDVIGQPEFSDVHNMRALFRTLQKRHQLGEILNRYRVGSGIQVHIGSENPNPDLSSFTLVTSTYGLGDRPLGTLGILGPIRMRYDRAIAVVDYVSKVFSHLLTEQIH